MEKPYSHRWSLPPFLSKSGLKPSVKARVRFVVIGVFFLLLVANGIAAAVTEGQMYPGVSVGHQAVGWKTQNQARAVIAHGPQSYDLTIAVGKTTVHTSTADIGASFDIDRTLALAYQINRTNPALVGIIHPSANENVGYAYQLDNTKLSRFTNQVVSAIGRPAVNATINVVNGQVVPVPDQNGLGINQNTVQNIVATSLVAGSSQTIHITPEPVQAAVQTDDLAAAEARAHELLGRTITLTYNDKNYPATPTNIGYWLKFTPGTSPQDRHQLIVTIDRAQVKGWVQSVANQINVQPVNKKVNVSNGVSTVEQQGTNGLAVDQDKTTDAIMAAMTADNNLTYAVPTSPVPFKTESTQSGGLSDARYIEINLSTQHLWAYQDGQVVESSPVTSGATGAGFPTVTGTFHIYYKTTNTYLNGHPYGYNYNVFVQYWMPFYAGYGLHDASWRSSFGGSDYYYGGSHGCVNLPLATAAFLYNWADVGTTVWVHT